jgi:hypothetical protein
MVFKQCKQYTTNPKLIEADKSGWWGFENYTVIIFSPHQVCIMAFLQLNTNSTVYSPPIRINSEKLSRVSHVIV